MRTCTRLPLALTLLLTACQSGQYESASPLEPLSFEVLDRLRVDGVAPSLSSEPIHLLGTSSTADAEGLDAPDALIELSDVLSAVEQHFPLLLAAMEEIAIADARLEGALGSFDTRLGSKGKFAVEDFYERDQLDVAIEQPLADWGMEVFGGYRLGAGDFAVYDGKAKTNDDGELRLGVSLPLLQGRAIDARRVDLWRARVQRDSADPIVLEKLLKATVGATKAYWNWVGWGRRREIALRLLGLAEARMGQVERAVEEGLIAPINLTENQRLIVERRSNLVGADRGLQEAAILLSLYWRDDEGRPSVPSNAELPYDFPEPRDPAGILVDEDIALALTRRPEVSIFDYQLAQLGLQRDLASNKMLPKLNLAVQASQDIGDAVSTPDDKGDFELEALLKFELPLQRREARGKLRESERKIAKLERERQFVTEQIVAEVQDAASALRQSWLRIEQARENLRLANELGKAERAQLREGESDLLRVNLREQQSALAAKVLVDVLLSYFKVLATYQTSLGIPYHTEP